MRVFVNSVSILLKCIMVMTDDQKREQPMKNNNPLKDFRAHYYQHSKIYCRTDYIQDHTRNFFCQHARRLLPKADTNMKRKLRIAFQIANSEPTSANLPSFPPCQDLRSKLPCAIHFLKVLEVT